MTMWLTSATSWHSSDNNTELLIHMIIKSIGGLRFSHYVAALRGKLQSPATKNTHQTGRSNFYLFTTTNTSCVTGSQRKLTERRARTTCVSECESLSASIDVTLSCSGYEVRVHGQPGNERSTSSDRAMQQADVSN